MPAVRDFYAQNLQSPVEFGARSLYNLGGYLRQSQGSPEIRVLGQQTQRQAEQLLDAFDQLNETAQLPAGTGQLLGQVLANAQQVVANEHEFYDTSAIGAARAVMNYLGRAQERLAAMQSEVIEPLVARHSAGDDSDR